MPRGVTPKERMKRSIMTLAKNLKPSGRLNVDDITKAGELRKGMSRSEFKDRAILKKLDTNSLRDKFKTVPRTISERYKERYKPMPMKPMPLTPEMLEKLKEKKFKKPTLPSVEDRGKRKEMKPLKAGGAAGQTKSTKRPMQSIFQQLKKAQMHRKMGTMGKK